jgi:uncharacterized protein (DUF433 family)
MGEFSADCLRAPGIPLRGPVSPTNRQLPTLSIAPCADIVLETTFSNYYHDNGFDWEQRMGQLDRITQQPDVMGGKACIRGMRVTVGMVVGQVGTGHSVEEILTDYPYLEREDIMQALRYAAWLSEET